MESEPKRELSLFQIPISRNASVPNRVIRKVGLLAKRSSESQKKQRKQAIQRDQTINQHLSFQHNGLSVHLVPRQVTTSRKFIVKALDPSFLDIFSSGAQNSNNSDQNEAKGEIPFGLKGEKPNEFFCCGEVTKEFESNGIPSIIPSLSLFRYLGLQNYQMLPHTQNISRNRISEAAYSLISDEFKLDNFVSEFFFREMAAPGCPSRSHTMFPHFLNFLQEEAKEKQIREKKQNEHNELAIEFLDKKVESFAVELIDFEDSLPLPKDVTSDLDGTLGAKNNQKAFPTTTNPNEKEQIFAMNSKGVEEEEVFLVAKQMFGKRKVWLKNQFFKTLFKDYPKFNRESHYHISKCWPLLAYSFKNGPWKHCLIEKGYDPRNDQNARIYQVLNVKKDRMTNSLSAKNKSSK